MSNILTPNTSTVIEGVKLPASQIAVLLWSFLDIESGSREIEKDTYSVWRDRMTPPLDRRMARLVGEGFVEIINADKFNLTFRLTEKGIRARNALNVHTE